MEKNIFDIAIILNPSKDCLAVAKKDILKGSCLSYQKRVIKVQQAIKRGNYFAICDIPKGEYLCQYGYAFGRSRGIRKGQTLSVKNVAKNIPAVNFSKFKKPPKAVYQKKYADMIFKGYVRKDGRVGTRNYYLVIPTSMCASETASQIAASLQAVSKKYKNFDGVIAIPHTEGCGCDTKVSINRLMRVLRGYAGHPNVGGCCVVDLGCEKTNYKVMHPFFKGVSKQKPIDWITIEDAGGVSEAKTKAERTIRSRLKSAARIKRQACPLKKLTLGTECGASDSFSGITANPLIGLVADKIVSAKGSAILSEVPEMVGTMHLLLPRFRTFKLAKRFQAMLDWYHNLARKLGLTLEDNLVAKNFEGGLVNSYLKSLGAVLKGGTQSIEDVVDYAEPLKKQGLNIMQGPGGDLESVTGMVASGANIVCFSTGQGTPTGNAICPVIKIATNNEVFLKLSKDMDFNAGQLLTKNITLDALADKLLDLVIKVASGQKTASERLGQKQFQIWTAGKLPL